MKTWFTSDHHFGHANIIKYTNRPFESVDEMDAELIRRWQERVDEEDVVFVLGDFSFHEGERTGRILDQLPGYKHLILGNHDRPRNIRGTHSRWVSIEKTGHLMMTEQKILVVMFHYPIHEWHLKHRGSYHLHGHSHGRRSPDMRRLDVGVDLWNYEPISWEHVHRELHHRPYPDPESRRRD